MGKLTCQTLKNSFSQSNLAISYYLCGDAKEHRLAIEGILTKRRFSVIALQPKPATVLRQLAGASDVHTHILPGLDDGAIKIENSIEMARVSVAQGTTVMIATPHRFYGGRENTPALIRSLAAQVQVEINRFIQPGDFTIVCGQEIPLTLSSAKELCSGETLTIGNAGMYALVEPPFDRLPEWIAEAISLIRDAGIVPILAHPERNSIVQKDPSLVREFVKAGALLQLTAMSVTGKNGALALEAANWMLEESLIAIVASDCHSASWRPPILSEAFTSISTQFGDSTAARLFVENPQKISASERLFDLHSRPSLELAKTESRFGITA